LELISKEELFTSSFVLSGGTALTTFYIPYRYSDDLDFFSQEEVNLDAIVVWLKTNKKLLNYTSFDVSTTYNRNMFFINYASGYSIKIEFTYYPFPAISDGIKFNNLKIDSQLDIAANKLFTIYQTPRFRDFSDLYELIIKNNFDIFDLIIKAKTKFDWDINYLQLTKQLQKVKIQKDIPRFMKEYNYKALEDFFEGITKKLIAIDLSNLPTV
jgi:predicted nucleotidyltransferase component of viral defense system